jgi:flagellar motor switch protein FliN/FliY
VELLRQISGVVAGSAKARWGEIQLLVEAAPAAPSWTSSGTFWLQIGEEGPSSMGVEVGVSAALAAELKAEKAEAAKSENTASAIAAAAVPSPLPAGSDDAAADNGAMGLLMDVPLAMTLHFGGKKLLLREVLELTAGSVVELDRKIQEPVDLLLDGRLVARGEVVVIDGSYGLRVTDVSPMGPS